MFQMQHLLCAQLGVRCQQRDGIERDIVPGRRRERPTRRTFDEEIGKERSFDEENVIGKERPFHEENVMGLVGAVVPLTAGIPL